MNASGTHSAIHSEIFILRDARGAVPRGYQHLTSPFTVQVFRRFSLKDFWKSMKALYFSLPVEKNLFLRKSSRVLFPQYPEVPLSSSWCSLQPGDIRREKMLRRIFSVTPSAMYRTLIFLHHSLCLYIMVELFWSISTLIHVSCSESSVVPACLEPLHSSGSRILSSPLPEQLSALRLLNTSWHALVVTHGQTDVHKPISALRMSSTEWNTTHTHKGFCKPYSEFLICCVYGIFLVCQADSCTTAGSVVIEGIEVWCCLDDLMLVLLAKSLQGFFILIRCHILPTNHCQITCLWLKESTLSPCLATKMPLACLESSEKSPSIPLETVLRVCAP